MSTNTVLFVMQHPSEEPYLQIMAYSPFRAHGRSDKFFLWIAPRIFQLHLALLINDGQGSMKKCELRFGGLRLKAMSLEELAYFKTVASFSDRLYISLPQLAALTTCIARERKSLNPPYSVFGSKSFFGGQKNNCVTSLEELLNRSNIPLDPIAFDKILALPLLHVRTVRSKLLFCKDLIMTSLFFVAMWYGLKIFHRLARSLPLRACS